MGAAVAASHQGDRSFRLGPKLGRCFVLVEESVGAVGSAAWSAPMPARPWSLWQPVRLNTREAAASHPDGRRGAMGFGTVGSFSAGGSAPTLAAPHWHDPGRAFTCQARPPFTWASRRLAA